MTDDADRRRSLVSLVVRVWDPTTGEEEIRLISAAEVHALAVVPPSVPFGRSAMLALGGRLGVAVLNLPTPR